MEASSSGSRGPDADLLQAALATCALEHFRGRSAAPYARVWSLAENSPLYNALLATAYEVQNFALGEDDANSEMVRSLHRAFKPNGETFLQVAQRTMHWFQGERLVVFKPNATLRMGVPYLEVASSHDLRTFCSDLTGTYGSGLGDFCFEISRNFRSMRNLTESQRLLEKWTGLATPV